MENLEKDIKLYSQEIKDILSTPPRSIFRWGNTLLMVFFLVFFLVSYFIKYPDTVKGDAQIISTPLTQNLIVDKKQNIDTIFVKNGERVIENSVIAKLKSSAKYEDVLRLKKSIEDFEIKEGQKIKFSNKKNETLIIGRLSKYYSSFCTEVANIKSSPVNCNYDNLKIKLDILKNQIKIWEDSFLLKSQINGKVFFSEKGISNLDKIYFYIVPSKIDSFFCLIEVNKDDLYKIEVGQKVNISLGCHYKGENLTGTVVEIPLNSNNNQTFFVKVSLPNKLITNKNKQVSFNGNIQGKGKIITEDLRIIERVFYNFKNLLDEK